MSEILHKIYQLMKVKTRDRYRTTVLGTKISKGESRAIDKVMIHYFIKYYRGFIISNFKHTETRAFPSSLYSQ